MSKPTNYNPRSTYRMATPLDLCPCRDFLCAGGYDCALQQFEDAYIFMFAFGRRLR